jgi:DNA-nicking Smr family endonuclease
MSRDEVPEDLPGDAPVDLPIDGVLDLHAFSPREVGTLVPDYLHECAARGLLDVRIIHGKGTGTLRERVHAILRRHPGVVSFRLADAGSGSWGATVVRLSPQPRRDGTLVKEES